LEKNVIDWIKRISKKKDELGGFAICPFAKKAFEEKKVFWSYIGYETEAYILRYIEATPDDFEVIIFYNLSKNLTNEDLLSIIAKLQEKMPDMVFLKDHPDNPGFINGVNTSNGEYPTILVQPRNKLEESRNKLLKTKYYDHWSEEYKKEIFGYGSKN
jgi:hypothetical protein